MAGDPNYRYIEGKSTACVYYFAIDDRENSLSVLPPEDGSGEEFYYPQECTNFYSSTMGLLLGEPYCVFNPQSEDSLARPIPTPPRPHHDHLPRSLVVYKNEDTGNHVFHVICALPSANPLYPPDVAHAFDVYSSRTNQWHLSQEHVLGRIRENTNVSCGTKAYWLTETPSVVCYNVADGSIGILPVPLKFWESGVHYRFQLGQRNVDLCFLVATEVQVEVYTLGSDRQWSSSLRIRVFIPLPAIPIRFQSKKFHLLFWHGRCMAAIDTSWGSEESASIDLQPRLSWMVRHPVEQPRSPADVLPLVKTDLDPYVDFLADP